MKRDVPLSKDFFWGGGGRREGDTNEYGRYDVT